jgi:hypothetical protein
MPKLEITGKYIEKLIIVNIIKFHLLNTHPYHNIAEITTKLYITTVIQNWK